MNPTVTNTMSPFERRNTAGRKSGLTGAVARHVLFFVDKIRTIFEVQGNK